MYPDQTQQQKVASDQTLHCCLQTTLVKFEYVCKVPPYSTHLIRIGYFVRHKWVDKTKNWTVMSYLNMKYDTGMV